MITKLDYENQKNELLENLELPLDFLIVFKNYFKYLPLIYVPIIKEKLGGKK